MFLSAVSQAQFNAKCPAGGLSLDQVTRFATQKLPDERAVAYIQRCQVNFTLDATALDRLIQAGASSKVLDALNALTASQLTREQAEVQVDSIENLIAAIGKSVDEERDAALQKFDAAYQVEIRKANQIDPKGAFEPTADYDKRVKDKDAKIAAMVIKHDQDRRQIVTSYSNTAHDREQLYRARIDFLKSATYPESRPLTYTSYNPDTQVLLAKIGDEAYGFYHVPPANAESLFKNWKQVRANEPWTEDAYHTRILVLASPSVTAAGVGIEALQAKKREDEQKKTEAMLAEANGYLNANNFVAANRAFLAVLARDPNNKAAQEGLAISQQAFVYSDPQTHLVWPLNDNGSDIDWPHAAEYCRALDTGGFHDWRLPSLAELKTVYDRTSSRETPPLPRDIHSFINGVTPYTFRRGTTWTYHIKPRIQLTQDNAWISTPPKTSGDKEAYAFSFNDSVKYSRDSTDGTFQRALCVRTAASNTQGSDTSQATASPQEPEKPASNHSGPWVKVVEKYTEECSAGNAKSCRLLASCYEHGNGVDKNLVKAAAIYQLSCEKGDSMGCTLAKYIQNKADKEKHP